MNALDRTYDQAEPAPPGNIEAEQALLGAIFLNNEAYFAVESIVAARDFSEEIHAEIFKACAREINAGRAATPITIKGAVSHFDLGEMITPAAYLARLAAEAVTVVHAPDYARAIKDEATRRFALEMLAEARQALLAPGGNATPAEVTANIAGALQEIAERGEKASSVSFGDVLQGVFDKAQRRAQGEEVGNFSTGLRQFDERLGGWRRSWLYVLGARPAMGKTALAISLMLKAANAGRGVACFALEVEDEQMGARAISALNSGDGALAYFRVMNFPLGDDSLQSIENTRRAHGHLPIEFDFTRDLTLSQIEIRARAMARKLKRKGVTLDLLIVDHIGLIASEGKSKDTRAQEVGVMSRRLRALGQRLNCAVILLSQLSREVESRDDKRPISSDLRESGSLEQDADVIGMLYRPAAYDEQTLRLIRGGVHVKGLPENFEAIADERSRDLEVIFTKVRAGKPGTDTLSCIIERNHISHGRF